MKKIFAVLLVLTMIFSFASCGDDSSQEPQNGEGNKPVYKVAMEPTFPPFDTMDEETGELAGFDYDYMNAIAEDQGFELEWVNMEFGGLVPALQAGNIDIIASGMNASEERREKVDFSTTYYDSGLVVAIKEGNILSSSYLNAISTLTGLNITISVPCIAIDMAGAIMSVPIIEFGALGDKVMYIEENFKGESNSLKSHVIMFAELDTLKIIMERLGF
jgi:ABC-type amino acid transport substrate-binding protein